MADSNTLLAQAREHIYQFEYEKAHDILNRARELDPNNTELLDLHAELLIEVNMTEEAKQLILRSIELSPNVGFTKYLNLGQIESGFDALNAISKATELLEADYKAKSNRHSGKLKKLVKDLVSSYCSIADVYLTDLCYEEDAEEKCGMALQMALKYNPDSFEALQAMASFVISQQKFDEALNYLTKSYSLWKELESDDEERPPFEFKLLTAKLFIELSEYPTASEILEELIEDDDQVSEVWYLLAFAYSHFDMKSSSECLEKAIHLLQAQGIETPSIWEQVRELEGKIKEAS